MTSKLIVFFLIFFSFQNYYSQELKTTSQDPPQKVYTTHKISHPPKIDGILNDEVWKDIPSASNFVMFDPSDGTPMRETHKTSVKVVYDDHAIYVAASMKDNEPERILRQFTQRDEIGQADFFAFDINTYNDGENETRFAITSSGAIADAKVSGEREDYSYDVVWTGKISFDADGWYAELRIPYSALRFPKRKEQLWGIQFIRKITHLNEKYSWNYVNKKVGKFTQYNGLLKGIKNINPPVRLSLYPYTSGEVRNYDGSTTSHFSAGMDIKYGINDAFTLDATLIPDFGQTAFDEVTLNLGPFEQTYNENRAFFTEGTELFTKGDLFYSRRVGDTPSGYQDVENTLLGPEKVIDNPQKVDLINAVKLSGRTDRNLGIGFFNAVTKKTHATVLDTITGKTREVVTEPIANYNILVLDQQFNHNSSVTLINTNVTRNGHFRDGNVTGFLYDIYNKANSFNFSGQAKMSNVNLENSNLTGFASEFEISRTKGKIRYQFSHELANETYDINDLGVNFINNYNNFHGDVSYRIFEPTKHFNEYHVTLYANHERRYKPDVSVGTGVGGNFFVVTHNRFAFGGHLEVNSQFRDFFEPRRKGNYITYSKSMGGETWVSSDYRNKFAYDIRVGYVDYFKDPMEEMQLTVSPRYRFSDRFSMIYSFRYNLTNNRNSFVALEPRNILFGNRDTKSIENSIQASYNFNTRQAINLNFRNFWSTASYAQNGYNFLLADGNLISTTTLPDDDPNANFNIWNLDLSYRWRFAPGSEAVLLYRNSLFNQDTQSELAFDRSLSNLLETPLRQNISLRIVYYIDYNKVKNIFKS
ncbi:MAG: DUF5916 domain-containing protein [Gillisia sp.]